MCVIGITVERYSMPVDDATEGEHVDIEQGWTKNRALGDPISDSETSVVQCQ